MKGFIVILLFSVLTLTACLVSTGPSGDGGVVVSPLPPVVELSADSYYYQNGYYYFYQDNHWRYSRSRSGPWFDLPRSHWPKEIRHRHDYRDRDDRDRDFRREYDRR